MRMTVLAAALAMASSGALADSASHRLKADPVCEKVTSSSERNARLAARDARAQQPTANPVAEYQRSKVTGQLRDGWRAIKAVYRGEGMRADPKLADALWLDFWCSELLPAYEDDPIQKYKAIKDAAGHGIPTAMIRLSYVYAKGEFGRPVDQRRAATLKEQYFATVLTKR
jgi:hypothetical protein